MKLLEQYLFERSNTLLGHVLDLKDIMGPIAKLSRSPWEMLKNGHRVSGCAFIIYWTLLTEDAFSLQNAIFRTFFKIYKFSETEISFTCQTPHETIMTHAFFFFTSRIHNLNSHNILRKHIIQVMTEGNGIFWFHLCRLVIYSQSQRKLQVISYMCDLVVRTISAQGIRSWH